MASMYPSLEDFKYDILIGSKHPSTSSTSAYMTSQSRNGSKSNNNNNNKYGDGQISIYPSFANNYLGLQSYDDSQSLDALSSAVSLPGRPSLKAPLSGYCQLYKLQPSNAIRPIVIRKDSTGKVGLRLNAIQSGVFVVLVYESSPAAMAGLKFGDQLLEINDIQVAGYSMRKVHDLIRKSSCDELRLAVRDRPLERTVTLHKDQNGLVGFLFDKHAKIVSIVKDSSAARNGLLIDHNMIEINAQNVVGLTRSEIRCILDNCGDVVTVTIIPTKVFKRLIKKTDIKLLRKRMDHSIPDGS